MLAPFRGDDRYKIFLTNLDGKINGEDLNEFFNRFGSIEHIECLTAKSAIILYSNINAVDRVLSKYRRCVINEQEIFVRRIRNGFIDRSCQDSSVLFIQPLTNAKWNEKTIRQCFSQYKNSIRRIRLSSSNDCAAWIYFDDYDLVDRILLEGDVFRVDAVHLDMRRAPKSFSSSSFIEKNKIFKRPLKRLLNVEIFFLLHSNIFFSVDRSRRRKSSLW